MISRYLSEKMIFSCLAKGISSLSPFWISSVTRSLVKKYSSRVRGSTRMDSRLMVVIHLALSTPSMGMITMGNTKATRIPLIMMVAI